MRVACSTLPSQHQVFDWQQTQQQSLRPLSGPRSHPRPEADDLSIGTKLSPALWRKAPWRQNTPSCFLGGHHVWWDLGLVPSHQFPGNECCSCEVSASRNLNTAPTRANGFPGVLSPFHHSRKGFGDREHEKTLQQSCLKSGQCQKSFLVMMDGPQTKTDEENAKNLLLTPTF